MNSQFPLDCRKLGSKKYDADRVSKTLKKIEHILDWQPSTYCTSAAAETQTRSRTAGHTAFLIGTPEASRCWNTVNESRIIAPRLGSMRENDLATVGDVNDWRVDLGHKEDGKTNLGFIRDQKHLRLTETADNVKRGKIWKSTDDDAWYGCEAAPIPADRATRPFEMRYLEKTTPKLSTNPSLGYNSCDVGQVDCHGNLADDNYATGCLETYPLDACFSDSQSDLCCRRYGFTRRRSVAECCEKHRGNTSTLSPDICRDSLRVVLSTGKDHLAREPLQRRSLETSANMESDMFGWVKQRNSWVSVPMSDATRSVEAAETKKTKEDLSLSPPHRSDGALQDNRRSVTLNRGFSPDMTDTTTSKKDINWETQVQPRGSAFRTITENSDGNRRSSLDNRRFVAFDCNASPYTNDTITSNKVFKEDNPVQPVSTPNGEHNRRGSSESKKFVAFDCHASSDMTGTATSNKVLYTTDEIPIQRDSRSTPNSESNRRRSSGMDERTFGPESRRDSSMREDRRRTSGTYPEDERYFPRQICESTVKTAGESSLSEADRVHSRSSTDSHGLYGQRMPSLNKRPSTGEAPCNYGKSISSHRRRSISAKRDRRRHRVSDSDCDCPTPASASSEKSWSDALASKDVRRNNPDAEEFLTMLQNQATMFCAVEAENKFLKSELISVRMTLGSLVEENSILQERLKQRLVDELLKTSEDVDRAQDMHRQGSSFVMSLAANNSPQSCENNAALSRLLTKYDFHKVKKEFETIIRLHRIKSDRLEAQLKFSRSEVQRLQLEATDLQRKLGCKDSFLPVDKLTRNSIVGLCVRCCNQRASVASCTDTSDNSCRQIRQLIKDRDELMERVLSAKSVCSFAMDREAELYGHWSSFIINFETAQLEVLEALRQRDELRDELNRVSESTRDDLQKERSCWKHQMEREQVESEQRNMELVRKNEELLSELENQNRKLCKNQRERDILQEKCESISCQILRIENDYTKEIEELRKSLCKLTHEKDDARQLVRMLEHQVVMATTASDHQQQGCKEPEQPVDGVLEKFSSLETHINSKVDQLQEYYGQALRDRDDVIQQHTALVKKLKKKYCRVKRRLRQSRRKQKKTASPEYKNQQKTSKTETL